MVIIIIFWECLLVTLYSLDQKWALLDYVVLFE
jgi:hypothetical protein